jgi:hypothetical protein
MPFHVRISPSSNLEKNIAKAAVAQGPHTVGCAILEK